MFIANNILAFVSFSSIYDCVEGYSNCIKDGNLKHSIKVVFQFVEILQNQKQEIRNCMMVVISDNFLAFFNAFCVNLDNVQNVIHHLSYLLINKNTYQNVSKCIENVIQKYYKSNQNFYFECSKMRQLECQLCIESKCCLCKNGLQLLLVMWRWISSIM